MGVVADELPNSCVEPFLKYIKENHSGDSVFKRFSGVPVKQEHPEQSSGSSMPTNQEKKRVMPSSSSSTVAESKASFGGGGNSSWSNKGKPGSSAGVKKKPTQGLSANQSTLNFAFANKKK